MGGMWAGKLAGNWPNLIGLSGARLKDWPRRVISKYWGDAMSQNILWHNHWLSLLKPSLFLRSSAPMCCKKDKMIILPNIPNYFFNANGSHIHWASEKPTTPRKDFSIFVWQCSEITLGALLYDNVIKFKYLGGPGGGVTKRMVR